MNVDAALDRSNGLMGFGYIIRDDAGNFVAARCSKLQGYYLPKEAEAIAVLEALSWLKSNTMDKCILESDCLQVVQALKSMASDDISYFDLIISDIKDACNHFSDISIMFSRRSVNRVAHELAREALSRSDSAEWFATPPAFICNTLLLDI